MTGESVLTACLPAAAALACWLVLGAPGPALAQDVETTTLVLHVEGLRTAEGQLLIHIYDTDKGFLRDGGDSAREVLHPVDGTAVSLQIDRQPRGRFAIAVIHDEDGDGELGTHLLGIPREGVGLSNNPRSRFGPPRFADAAVEIDGERMVLDITIRYL